MPSARGLEPGDTAADFKLRNARSFVIEEKHSDPSKNSFKPVHMTLEQTIGETGGVIMFTCNHCPYVKAIMSRLVRDVNELKKFGINTIAISSNDVVNYPEDSFENMKLLAEENHFEFPYVFDETQEIAKAYDAICTPDFFGFNSKLELQYRGRFDSTGRGEAQPNNKRELFEAMKLVAETQKGPEIQHASIGCSIKWKEEHI